MTINWNKLQPYKLTKQKSFEQLCYQVARKLFESQGVFTPIDDSGGGDGVEFYLTFIDGTQWGWQAKYYERSIRLNVHNRKQNIINSLKRAIEIHPNLSIWFLCLPMDLTTGETNWLNNELPKHIPFNRKVLIGENFLWNESFIHEKLNQPKFNGLKQAFFNELELSHEWFLNAFDNSFSVVKNKFDELLYVVNEEFEFWYVNPILCNNKFKEERIAYYPKKLKELYANSLEKKDSLNYTSNDEWKLLFEEYKKEHLAFNKIVENLIPRIESRYDSITPNQVNNLKENDFNEEIELLSKIEKDLEEYRIEWRKQNLSVSEQEDKKKENYQQFDRLWKIEDVQKKIIEELRYYVRDSCIPTEWRIGHYLGNSGDGKTNFAIALTREYLDRGNPVIFVPAIKFTGSNPLHEQILSLYDIKSTYSFSDFLDCLNELGKINDVRVPIIFDGLNEALNSNGFLNERLSLDMPTLENEILKRKNIALITTSRSSYKKTIWGDVNYEDKRFHSIYGFTNEKNKKKLIKKYFEHYKIQADLSFLSLQRFTKPLYLKIFCESVNPTRKEVKQITLGYDSIYSIFENFVDQCNQNVFHRIEKNGKFPPTTFYKRIATNVLKLIAQQLWIHPARSFSLEELMKITDGNNIVIEYKNSIAKALLDEELLFIRNWDNGEENVYLTYDLMAGYFIAGYLLDSITDYKSFLLGDQIETLIGEDYEKLHPNHEDVLDSLCSLLPIKKEIFVHDLFENTKEEQTDTHHILFAKSIKSTVLLSPEYIPTKQVKFIEKLCAKVENISMLISFCEGVLFVSNHPFNFSFWSRILKDLSMNERDITWTEYLRDFEVNFLEDLISEFESLQAHTSLTEEQIQKIYLVADFLMWSFTSTNKSLKSKSSNALYLFAIKFPKIFIQKFYSSVEINDPTIFEWMIMVLYNVIIYMNKTNKKQYEENLIEIATFLRNEILNAKGKFNTNHLIVRNYAYNILTLLVRKITKNPSSFDLVKIKNEFKTLGINKWEEAEDINKYEYSDGNSLIDYYFNKEKMPYVIIGKGDQYNETPEFKSTKAKLRWRAYQIGYKFQSFGEIDKQIAKYKHYGEAFAHTDRYADKYIDIAFFEYCGFLEGLQKFKSHYDIGYLRTFNLKHDPTKVEKEKFDKEANPRFVIKNYIDANITLKEWYKKKEVPDIDPYLIINRFHDKEGKFVLLNSLVNQHNKKAERQIFFKIDIVFIKNKSLKIARKGFTEKIKLGWANDSIPTTSNIHESEIPDADIIPYNEFTTWYYSDSTEVMDREYTTIELIQNGKKLNKKDADIIWNNVLQSNNYLTTPRTSLLGTFIYIKLGNSKDKRTLDDLFQEANIELREKKFIKKQIQEIDKEIEVFSPVRSMNNKIYVCKNIIDYFKLSSNSENTDLIDDQGNLASFNFTYELEYADQESFTYIRRDLLDKYLKENELTMFTIIWGERDYYPPDGDWTKNTINLSQRRWAKFYKAIPYKPENSL